MSATTEHRSRVCGGWATGHTKVDARSNQEGHVEVTIGVDAIKFRAMLTLTEATALADQLREAVRDV